VPLPLVPVKGALLGYSLKVNLFDFAENSGKSIKKFLTYKCLKNIPLKTYFGDPCQDPEHVVPYMIASQDPET